MPWRGVASSFAVSEVTSRRRCNSLLTLALVQHLRRAWARYFLYVRRCKTPASDWPRRGPWLRPRALPLVVSVEGVSLEQCDNFPKISWVSSLLLIIGMLPWCICTPAITTCNAVYLGYLHLDRKFIILHNTNNRWRHLSVGFQAYFQRIFDATLDMRL